jgi:hypothetical protein
MKSRLRAPVALTSPSLNRGTAFAHHARRKLRLTGRLTSAILTLDDDDDNLLDHIDHTARAYLEGRPSLREWLLRPLGVW